jgi:septum formation inhibitor-activating ATPase MinD
MRLQYAIALAIGYFLVVDVPIRIKNLDLYLKEDRVISSLLDCSG